MPLIALFIFLSADYSKPPKAFVNVTKAGELPIISESLLQHTPEKRNTPICNGALKKFI